MFTQQFMQEIEKAFEKQMNRLGERRSQVEDVLGQCSAKEAEALKCLYASMPVSDAADYPAALYLAYAEHGVYLWEKGPYAGEIPEKLFAGYVLNHRVNNEDLADCRSFFYEQLKDRISGKTMKEAILDINYWCASQASYRTSDDRTANALCVYRSAYGRCGEESVFAVSVFRSMGIPARQVYVPLWSHCDDNHAWVEVWCEGEWRFLGACEPEETLNKGWFTNASSRAMMAHSRWMLPVKPEEDIVGKRGMSLMLNQLKRYAETICLEITVRDQNENPVPDARVCLQVLNYAQFGEIASLHTGDDGKGRVETGLGSVLVTAFKDGNYGETLINTREVKSCTLILGDCQDTENVWEDMVILAPKDSPKNRCIQSEEEINRGRKKAAAAVSARLEKENHFYDEELAKAAVAGFSENEKEYFCRIMHLARGNQKEIADFLSRPTQGKWPEKWKQDLLNSLREKDYLDITADILEENCRETAAFADTFSDEIFVPYILCPRVENEMIRPFRPFIRSWLSEKEKTEIEKNPSYILKLMQEKLKTDPDLEYGNLVTSAEGALTTGYGSVLTKKIVSVQILRTLGIPARLHPADHTLEIWQDGSFVPLEEKEGGNKKRTAELMICGQEGTVWTYQQNWTIARLEGDGYQTLRMCGEREMLFPGKYRILTANRLPNGNIFAKKLVFELKDGEKRRVDLKLMEAQPSDLLEENDITDFCLKKEDGTVCRVSELVKEKKGLFFWLEEGQEPTEHILNEIYERKEEFAALDENLYFVISSLQAKENPTLKKALENVPDAQCLLDEFGADMEVLARRMYLEPGRLPLIVIIDEAMMGIYGVAGYNVGTADMILKIL